MGTGTDDLSPTFSAGNRAIGLADRVCRPAGGNSSSGVARAEFNTALLKQGKLKADHLCVRFADGTLIDSDNADALPPVMNLPETEHHELTVVLALPHEHENGGNCLQPEQRAERPVRWRLAWREVRNRYGEDCRQIAVMQPELTLREADSDNADYQTVAAIRLTRDSQDTGRRTSLFCRRC